MKATEIVTVLFCVILIVGQIKCVFKFFSCDFEPSYKAEIVYGVSLITGLGCITGWMDFGK